MPIIENCGTAGGCVTHFAKIVRIKSGIPAGNTISFFSFLESFSFSSLLASFFLIMVSCLIIDSTLYIVSARESVQNVQWLNGQKIASKNFFVVISEIIWDKNCSRIFSNLSIWIFAMKSLAVCMKVRCDFLISVFYHRNLFRLLLPRIRWKKNCKTFFQKLVNDQ